MNSVEFSKYLFTYLTVRQAEFVSRRIVDKVPTTQCLLIQNTRRIRKIINLAKTEEKRQTQIYKNRVKDASEWMNEY